MKKVNIMPQHRPCGRAYEIKELSNYLLPEEYKSVLLAAKEEGILRLDKPFLSSSV